jgi:hypothetical protein
MVRDLGRDYYKLSGPELEALGERVKSGDMEQVLRVYEQEMQASFPLRVSPVADRVESTQKRLDGQSSPNLVDSSPEDQGTSISQSGADIRPIYRYLSYP